MKLKFIQPETETRLSHPNIREISQDVQGFLWVGTDDGLNRFDGYDYKIYRNIPGDTASLISNYVQCIFEDSQRNLWVSTLNNGLHIYDRTADAFIRISAFSQQGTQVMRIIEDHHDNIWIGGTFGTEAFVAKYSKSDNSWKILDIPITNDPVFSMLAVSEHELWLGTRFNSIFRLNTETDSMVQVPLKSEKINGLPSSDVEAMVMDDKSGIIWIATRGGGLSSYTINTQKFKTYNTSNSSLSVNELLDLSLNENYLWIATENGGLCRMNLNTKKIDTFKFDKFNPYSVVSNSIWSLFTDNQGRIWVGSYARGLCVLDPYSIKFEEISLPISSDLINSMVRDKKNRLWIGTEDGAFVIDKDSISQFAYNPKNKRGLSNKAINCVFEDSKGQIWLGFWNGGLNLYNEKSRDFTHFMPEPGNEQSLGNPNVFSIHEYSVTGELMVCTFGGLYILKDQKNMIFEHAVDQRREGDQLLLTAYEDKAHNIWIGSYTGLTRYHPDTKEFERFDLTADSTKSVRVNIILQDTKERLWVGTSMGLFQMTSFGKFKIYTVEDGLPVNYIQGILEDRNGHLWLGTTNGLTLFDPEKVTFKTYVQKDGLSSNEFRRKAFLTDVDGKIMVGSKGLNVFDPDKLTVNEKPPQVYISGLSVLNKMIKPGGSDGILKSSIQETDEITLKNRNSLVFSIYYVGLNFSSPSKNRYAYKLEGFDAEWNDVNDQRFATFTNLDPGTYTFKVRACNNDGIWNETGASLKIHILPPWYKTWWFRSSGILLLMSLALGFYFYRINSIKTQNRRLEEQVTDRTSELKTRNEELASSKEEIAVQWDLVVDQNRKLEDAQKIIEEKNKKILEHNQILEQEVDRRTKELVAQNIQLQQFAFITAHNLRAPVARILGLGQLLKYPASRDEEKDILNKITNNTIELDVVVKDLNTILDIQYNSAKIWVTVDLAEELQNVLTSLHREIIETETEVKADFASISKLYSVKSYINSILLNLVSNAIKYRYPGRPPVITMNSSLVNQHLILDVTDNGVGIDMEKHGDGLFKLYKRFHTHVDGKGMGLYMVKTQVEALGGIIEAEGKVDAGLSFKIRLPLKAV